MNPKDKPGYAYRYLINKGLSKEAAAGIVGNLQAESGLDTTIKGTADDKGSIGIAQWHSGRKKGLLNFAKQQNREYDDLDLQLDYIIYELDQPEYKIAKNKMGVAKSPQEAALAFMNHYEKPAEWAKKQSMGQRVGVAQSLYANTPANYEGVKQQIQYDDRPVGDYYTDSTVNLNQDSGEYITAPENYEQDVEDVEGETAKQELAQQQQEKNFLEDFQKSQQQQQQQDFSQGQGYSPQQSGYELYVPELPEIQAQQAPSYFQDGGVQGVIDYTKFNKILKRFEEGGDFVDTYSDVELEADTEAEDEGKPKPGTKKPAIPKFEYKKKSIDDVIKQNKENLYKTSERDNISNLATPVKRNVEAQAKQKEYKEKTTVSSLDEYSKELANKATLEDTIENKDIDLGIGLSNYKTVGERKKLQKFLIDQGYNLNPEGKFENEGIDGKIGKVTLKAVQEYNKNLSNPNYHSFKEGEGLLGQCTEGQCSEYTQNELFRNIQPNVSRQEWNEKTGLYGNAWDIGKNITSKGGKEIEKKTVKPGDVVTMYTGGSSAYQREADAAGTGTTHVGIVDKVNPDGSYYILHNNHTGSKDNWQGREFRELVKNDTTGIHNFTVKHAFRPKYEAIESGEKKIIREDLAIKIDPKKSAKLSSGNYNNLFTTKSAKEKLENYYIKPLNDSKNKKALSKVFNLGDDEYNSLAKASLGILGQESDFGTNILYTTGTKRTAATGLKTVGYKKDEVSKGAGQMKYETNFGKDDLTEIGITKDNFNDEDKASLITMYKVSRDYKKFLNKGFSKKDALYRAVTNYNSSMGNVVNGKKVEDWAKTYDVDYTNKVLNFSNIFDVTDGKKSYKTTSDKLLLNKNVAKWKAELKKANKL